MSTQPENVPAQSRSSHLRLLPWTENDKPAYLSTHNTETYLSRLADTVENQQTEAAAVILGLAQPMVEDTANLGADELRWIATRLIESLTDVLRVCESRAGRIPPYEGDTAAQDDSDAVSADE
ncbi:hypothetical protein [Streptomyces griseoaurantiacus]|uniref:hypothetical protein n=1 Tax=Streptomyces griseoaurantiacus TaxID=68213 RepID=UPI002E288067|nr:hypothetical protein [Streptomyces jietaisiensis]